MQLVDLLERLNRYPDLYRNLGASFLKKEIAGLSFSSITDDSRKVEKGSLFVAITGEKQAESQFIPDAIKHGATIIVASQAECQHHKSLYPTICFLPTSHPRHLLAYLAGAFYERQPENVVAVTGTNGKTSVVTFTRQLWENLGIKAASLGTLGLQSAALQEEKHLTTPDPLYLHKNLQRLADEKITHLAMEASSHGIDQHRLDAVRLKAAAFTNLSADHLDYHHTLKNYLEAKMHLFDRILPPDGIAVLNADIPEFKELVEKANQRKIWTYGRAGKEIRIESIEPLTTGQKLTVEVMGKAYTLHLPLLGEFQAYNALCALGLVLATVSNPAVSVIPLLEKLQGVPGRIELIGHSPNGAPIYVDYAHASGGIETLLKSLRHHVKGELWIVFGAGGGRDPSTRPLMGQVAHDFADHVVVCDDNPRFENPHHIRQQILSTCPQGVEIPDRKEAIRYAINHLGPDDLLVITGKGPEDGQIVQGITYPFLDKAVIQDILKEVKR